MLPLCTVHNTDKRRWAHYIHPILIPRLPSPLARQIVHSPFYLPTSTWETSLPTYPSRCTTLQVTPTLFFFLIFHNLCLFPRRVFPWAADRLATTARSAPFFIAAFLFPALLHTLIFLESKSHKRFTTTTSPPSNNCATVFSNHAGAYRRQCWSGLSRRAFALEQSIAFLCLSLLLLFEIQGHINKSDG